MENDPVVEKFTERSATFSRNTQWSENSFIGVLNQINQKKCLELCTILDRLISNLHFSQTMNEYLALDEKIEPAKMVLLEAIKQGPNLGNILRGGSFASCAQVYRHLSSKFDSDNAHNFEQRKFVRGRGRGTRRGYPSRRSFSYRGVGRSRGGDYPYTLGYCWNFQRPHGCSLGTSCAFTHACTNCQSSTHGVESCPTSTHNSST